MQDAFDVVHKAREQCEVLQDNGVSETSELYQSCPEYHGARMDDWCESCKRFATVRVVWKTEQS